MQTIDFDLLIIIIIIKMTTNLYELLCTLFFL